MPVASGTKSGCVHALASRRKIMPGDIDNVDVRGFFFRCHANMRAHSRSVSRIRRWHAGSTEPWGPWMW